MSKNEKTTSVSERKKTPVQLTKRAVAGWLAVFFIISAWMFVLGIFVGRGTAPVTFELDKLQKELASLKEAVIKKDKESIKADTDAFSNIPDVDFHEALKKSEVKSETHTAVARTETPAPKKTEKEASVKKPADTAAKEQHDISIDRDADENKTLTLQVSAVKDMETADKLVARLKEKGYPAYRITRKISETEIWYRVRVGYFKDKKDAMATIQRLKKEKFEPILMYR